MAGREEITATWAEVLRLFPELLRLLRGLLGGDDVDVLGVMECCDDTADCHDLVRALEVRFAERNPLSTEVDEASDLVFFLDRGF